MSKKKTLINSIALNKDNTSAQIRYDNSIVTVSKQKKGYVVELVKNTKNLLDTSITERIANKGTTRIVTMGLSQKGIESIFRAMSLLNQVSKSKDIKSEESKDIKSEE